MAQEEEEEEDDDDEDTDSEEEEEEVPKKKGKKARKLPKKGAVDEMIEKLTDSKVIILMVAVLGFIMYNRSKQQEMQMLLKMKELEM